MNYKGLFPDWKDNEARPLSMADAVYEKLKTAIVRIQYEPGARLYEQELAETLGISRTPLREALRRLESEGLVVRIPNGGVRVSGLSVIEVNEIYAIRLELEGLAARQAAINMTPETVRELREVNRNSALSLSRDDYESLIVYGRLFHEIIHIAAGNRKNMQFLSQINTLIERYRYVSITRSRKSVGEHSRITGALAGGDAELAERLMQEHIERERNLVSREIARITEKEVE